MRRRPQGLCLGHRLPARPPRGPVLALPAVGEDRREAFAQQRALPYALLTLRRDVWSSQAGTQQDSRLIRGADRPLPPDPRSGADGRIQRLEVMRNTTPAALLRDVAHWSAELPSTRPGR
ncbi:hypothetical protein ACFW40_05905 [Streptomyces sp. NPDC058807]|uniref:hypothetical protein n=1 Tax=unclassified Streptomyces TaxID=2593676 RepID=UPI0036C0CBEE